MSDNPVRDQYEDYPYPSRDPADEAKRLIIGSPSHMLEYNHYVFGGARDFSKPFRALCAGGGTGDGAIMMAQQLADTGGPGEVVYVDLSTSSRAIAEARAKARGLTNISFHTMSLLDIPDAGLGPFDYINCCGVLHHLPDPPAGFRALTSVLAENGGMGIMVYGELGRTGIYDFREIMETMYPDARGTEKIRAARKLLAALPNTNRLLRNSFVSDHKKDDAHLHDMLLNAIDRAYLVPEIYGVMDACGLDITAFVTPISYDPATYTEDEELVDRFEELSYRERCAVAELMTGNLFIHRFYVVHAGKSENAVARICPEAIPHTFQLHSQNLAQGRYEPGKPLTFNFTGLQVQHILPDLSGEIMGRVDGNRSLGDIHAELQAADPDLDWETFEAIFGILFSVFNGGGALFLTMRGA